MMDRPPKHRSLKFALAISAALLTLSNAPANGPKTPANELSAAAALGQIMARERAFSDLARESGTRAAFLAFIADDGIIFTPAPVVGKTFLHGTPDGRDSLSWTPRFAGMSASADLGFTSGPYVWTNGPISRTGQYLTIWRRQPNGDWRFVLDRGTTGPAEVNPGSFKVVELGASGVRSLPAGAVNAESELLADEQALSRTTHRSAATGLTKWLASDARIFREGVAPALNAADRSKQLVSGPKTLQFQVVGQGVSAAGDLGYTYGEATWDIGATSHNGNFVRLWQKRGTGWQVIIDSLVAMPSVRVPTVQ